MTNLAFHNDPALAQMVRERAAFHIAADQVVQGTYAKGDPDGEDFRGCFIGCLAHSEDTGEVERLTGFPVMLTRLAESIFEGLPREEAPEFFARVMAPETVRIGADLSLVAWKFLHWLVDDVLREHGTDAVRAACSPAREIVAAKARGEVVDKDAAADAADAAYAAYAARAAAYAAYAAADAADAADAAAYAADAAARAADAARRRQADKFIKLLAAA